MRPQQLILVYNTGFITVILYKRIAFWYAWNTILTQNRSYKKVWLWNLQRSRTDPRVWKMGGGPKSESLYWGLGSFFRPCPNLKVNSHRLPAFFVWFILRPCQHDDGYIDGRSQIKVHTDERTQVHSARSSLTATHPSTNRGRRCLTSVNVSLS